MGGPQVGVRNSQLTATEDDTHTSPLSPVVSAAGASQLLSLG